MEKLDTILKKYEALEKKKPINSFQSLGLHIAMGLGDKENIALYISLAKKERPEILEQAYRFCVDYPKCDNITAMFLWKLGKLKEEHKTVLITNSRSISIVTDILLKDKLAIVPTDTGYKIICRLFARKTIDRMYKAIKKSAYTPSVVLIDSLDLFAQYTKKTSIEIERILNTCWPGKLGVVRKVHNPRLFPLRVMDRKEKSVCFRWTKSKFINALISSVGEPLVANSIIVRTAKPLNLDQIPNLVKKRVDIIIKDSTTYLSVQNSTIIKIYENDSIELIRPGAIPKSIITF